MEYSLPRLIENIDCGIYFHFPVVPLLTLFPLSSTAGMLQAVAGSIIVTVLEFNVIVVV